MVSTEPLLAAFTEMVADKINEAIPQIEKLAADRDKAEAEVGRLNEAILALIAALNERADLAMWPRIQIASTGEAWREAARMAEEVLTEHGKSDG